MDFGQVLLYCCFIPFLVLGVAVFFIVRNFSKFLTSLPKITAPDTDELHKEYEQLRATYPNDSQQQLVKRVINQYALRQGIVGAVTSVGGIIALPLGLSVDLVYAARSNAGLSYFIAQIYGIESEEKSLNISQLLILRQRTISPDEIVMWQEKFAGAAYQQIAQAILQKSLAKVIPGLGAFIGFAVDWSSAQVFGRVADAYYSGNLETLTGSAKGFIKDISSVEKRDELWKGFTETSAKLVNTGLSGVSTISQKLKEQNYDPTADRLTQLNNLVALKEKGALTEAEFNLMKQAILGGLAEQMDTIEEEVLDIDKAEEAFNHEVIDETVLSEEEALDIEKAFDDEALDETVLSDEEVLDIEKAFDDEVIDEKVLSDDQDQVDDDEFD